MNNSSPLAPSGILGTIAKLVRLTENLGVGWSHWLHPTNNKTARANFAEYLKFGCPKVSADGMVVTPTLPEGADLARLILGDDFVSPEEICEVYGFSYSEDYLTNFEATLPDLQMLLWLRINDYMLVAGPNVDLNLLGVRALDRSEFYYQNDGDGWFEDKAHTFSQADIVCGGKWLMLRKGDMPNSRLKNWREQLKLLSELERVPNVAEVSYGVTVYRKVRSVYLLPNLLVRTSSVDADCLRVFVGDYEEQGLCVGHLSGDAPRESLGVSSTRN